MENLLVLHSLGATNLLLLVFRAISDVEVPGPRQFAKGLKLGIVTSCFIPAITAFAVVWFISVLGVFLASIELAAVAKMAAPFLWGLTAIGTLLAVVSILVFLAVYFVGQFGAFSLPPPAK